MAKISVITDCDMRGSGYFNLMMPLLQGLAEKGHDIKIAAMGYKGEEHQFDFSMIPAQNMQEAVTIVRNLSQKPVWPFDWLIVGLDIPIQQKLLQGFTERDWKYMGIFPVESDPLSFEWSMDLMKMEKTFCISEFGTEECKKRYVEAEHLVVGMNTEAWRPPSVEEKSKLRRAYGIEDDEFVVLTVADNQERKNLDACMRAFSYLVDDHPKSRYIMVTRQHFFAGWNLDELALKYQVGDKFMPFERGMAHMDLWGLYAIADCFLLLSKSEGLCMPTLEAMACGLPVVATNCTAQIEHLSNNRGFLVDYLEDENYGFPPVDPFGGGHRYWASPRHAATIMLGLAQGKYGHDREAALEYIYNRTWDKAVEQVNEVVSGETKEE